MLKKIILATLVAIPMLLSAQTVKIGVVDTQAIARELPAFKEVEAKLAEIGKKYEAEYAKLRTEAQAKYEEFQNMPKDTPQAVQDRRAKELDDFSKKLAEFEQMAQNDMVKQQQELTQPVITSVQQAIQSIGKEGNYTMIQEAAGLLYYGAPAEDITPQVKARLGIK